MKKKKKKRELERQRRKCKIKESPFGGEGGACREVLYTEREGEKDSVYKREGEKERRRSNWSLS